MKLGRPISTLFSIFRHGDINTFLNLYFRGINGPRSSIFARGVTRQFYAKITFCRGAWYDVFVEKLIETGQLDSRHRTELRRNEISLYVRIKRGDGCSEFEKVCLIRKNCWSKRYAKIQGVHVFEDIMNENTWRAWLSILRQILIFRSTYRKFKTGNDSVHEFTILCLLSYRAIF